MASAGGTAPALPSFRVVLVDPQDSRNVGSVARLVSCYGIDDVVVVSTRQLEWEKKRQTRVDAREEEEEVEKREGAKDSQAKGKKAPKRERDDPVELDGPGVPLNTRFWRYAEMLATPEGLPRLHRFRVLPSLAEGIEGCVKAVAFTGKTGAAFRTNTVEVPGLPQLAALGKVALVFGNEAKGLSSNDTLLCSGVCTLPTSSRCTSLNLSHAVAVVLSRLWEMLNGSAIPNAPAPAPVAVAADAEIGEVMETCRGKLEEMGYPVAKSEWGGTGRRKNKYAYRIHKHVTGLVHVLQRAQATTEEVDSVRKLIALFTTPPKERRADDEAGSDEDAEGAADDGMAEDQS